MSGYVGYLGKYRHQNNEQHKANKRTEHAHVADHYRSEVKQAKQPRHAKVIAPQFDVQRLDAEIESMQQAKKSDKLKSCKIVNKKSRKIHRPDITL